MIGLGSNRLTVCRRGGMSVTQAGRGGMEWLAGGRMPSWASPYSAQATAALLAQFPTQWPTIRDYGVAHPEIVPYVNANPLCAAIWCCYVQDGLVFQMDCNYECTAAKWKDVRSAIEFIGTGMSLVDGVPQFGSGYYSSNDGTRHSYNTCTIEVVFKPSANISGYTFLYSESDAGRIAMTFGGQGLMCNAISADNCFGLSAYANTLYSVSAANTQAYANETALSKRVWGDSWSSRSGKWIGVRDGSAAKFNGKIYSIRIYNRLLTEQEILANQAIDLQRWQPS